MRRFYLVIFSLSCFVISSCNNGANLDHNLTNSNNKNFMNKEPIKSKHIIGQMFSYLRLSRYLILINRPQNDGSFEVHTGGGNVFISTPPGPDYEYTTHATVLALYGAPDPRAGQKGKKIDVFISSRINIRPTPNDSVMHITWRQYDDSGRTLEFHDGRDGDFYLSAISPGVLASNEEGIFIYAAHRGTLLRRASVSLGDTTPPDLDSLPLNFPPGFPDGDGIFVNLRYLSAGKFMVEYRYTDGRPSVYLQSIDDGETWTIIGRVPSLLYTSVTRFYMINDLVLARWVDANAISGDTPIEICNLGNQLAHQKSKQNADNCNLYDTKIQQDITGVAANSTNNNPPSIILASGSGGDITMSTDGGQTWTKTTTLPVSNLSGIYYDPDNDVFYAGGQDNNGKSVVYMSSDIKNGTFWQNITIPRFSKLFAANNTFCGIVNDPAYPARLGEADCWGDNGYGQLGLGKGATITNSLVPTPVVSSAQAQQSLAKPNSTIQYTLFAGGSSHSCALTNDQNNIYCSGSGALGDGIVHESGYSTPIPTLVKIPTTVQKPILSLVGGGTHECLLDSAYKVWCWGSNQYGEIDPASLQQFFPSPVMSNLNIPSTYSSIASGNNFTCGIENRNQKELINCWGTGFSTSTNPLYQVTSSASDFGNFTNITAGGNSACIISGSIHSGGTNLWCFGDNTYGQLGNGESGPFTLSPQTVKSNVPESSGPGVKQLFFSKVVQSSLNTCGLEANTGYVYCWGDDEYKQTGVPNISGIVSSPTTPIVLKDGIPSKFVDLAIGQGSICAIAIESGNLNTYCFGNGHLGQLGDRSLQNSANPSLVNTLIDIESQESSSFKRSLLHKK